MTDEGTWQGRNGNAHAPHNLDRNRLIGGGITARVDFGIGLARVYAGASLSFSAALFIL